MPRTTPHSLNGPARALAAARDGVFAAQHFWPLALVVGVLLWAGGAFVYGAVSGGDSGSPPVVTAASGGVAASSLSIASDPSGATVVVDGDTVGTTPFGRGGLRAGEYHVVVSAEGLSADTLVHVGVSQGVAVALRLRPEMREPLAAAATRILEPTPPTRAIPAAEAPAAGPTPPAPPLTPPAPPTDGAVEVTVQPWGTVVIDGAMRQRDTDVTVRQTLAPGPHRIRVEHPTLGVRERDVRLQPGQTLALSFDLNAPADAP